MINIVFEGLIDNEIIEKIYKNYSIKYKVGISNIDTNYKLYKTIKSPKKTKKEILLQSKKYISSRENLYCQNNDINLFNKNYISIYAYNLVFLNKQLNNNKEFLDNVLNRIKSKEKEIDLLVFFKSNINIFIKNYENKYKIKYTKKEKQIIKKIDYELTDYIRYHNSEYKILVVNNKDNIEKIIEKIDEIIIDKNKQEDDKWYELYKKEIEKFKTPEHYIKHKLKCKKIFINKVIQYSKNGKALETGCGTGIMSGYLQKKGLKVTVLDLNKKILNYAKELAKESNIIIPCNYTIGDILNLNYKQNTFDVSYSNGVLEHFNDEDIIKTLKQQMYISQYVIFGVPSNYFTMDENMFGNERRLTLDEWKKLIHQANGKIIEQTGFHYYKLHQRIIKINKWFKPKEFWLFVIKKNN